MKKSSILFLFLFSRLFGQTNKAAFDYFEYKGNDPFFTKSINVSKQYFNPIVAGFYPDPSVCRKGEDYYLVNSSFSYYPGIPIWHSKDLVNWQQIGHVLDRPSQLKLDGLDLSAGIFAPTIRYNPANKTFYVICTVARGIYNFLVKTQDLKKGWSDPILLPKVKGMDPSILFDDDGKTYIVNCGEPVKALWRGHRSIWLFEYDTQKDVIIDEGKIIADAGIDTSKHPIWLEGPHLYKIKGKYYLMAAEGGTGDNHSEVIFESDHVKGPYKPCAINPILSQRNLPSDRADKITSTGHADLVETPTGKWYAVFLATRPYVDNLYNTGRETFLLPVEWKHQQPIILDSGKAVPVVVNYPALNTKAKRPTGNFIWKDDFNQAALAQEWNMLRTPRDTWYNLESGQLVLNAIDRSIYDKVNPAFIGRRQQHMGFTATTRFSFVPKSNNELSGMVLFQNEKNNIVIGKTIHDGKTSLLVINRLLGKNQVIANAAIADELANKPVQLQIVVNKGLCQIFYALGNDSMKLLAKDVDIQHLSTKVSGGFVGSYVGMYATQKSNITQ